MAGIVTGFEVLEGYAATFRAYVELEGDALLRADCSSIAYTITDLQTGSAVAGHSNQALTVADVVFDTLQEWSKSGGYNFRFTVSTTAFPEGSRPYRVKVNITTTDGGKLPAIWIVQSVETGE